jgi:hypothetical protein
LSQLIGITNLPFGRENAFADVNNSHERPINGGDLLPNKEKKRRIFSSTGARKPRVAKQRNRIQTAKYIRTVNKAVNNRWSGGGQLHSYYKRSENPSSQGKYSDKKRKKIPFTDYKWPENDINNLNNPRPATAKHGDSRAVGRGASPKYGDKRRNIQSRGKAAVTGLTGTSQSDKNGSFSKTQNNLIDQNFKDLILAESDPVEMSSENSNQRRSGGINLEISNTDMGPIREESGSKHDPTNDSPGTFGIKVDRINEDPQEDSSQPTFNR